MALVDKGGKEFELPQPGQYIVLLVDVVDLGLKQTQFGMKPKTRVNWLVFGQDAQGNVVPVVGKDGTQLGVMAQVGTVMNDKAQSRLTLYEIARGTLNGQTPPIPFETETMIGKANLAYIVQEQGKDGKTYANIKLLLPLPATIPVPAIPASYVRAKDRQQQAQQAVPAAAAPVVVVPQPAVAVAQPQPAVHVAVPQGVQGSPVIDLSAGAPAPVRAAF